MAHFEARKVGGRLKCIMLEHSPSSNLHTRSGTILERSSINLKQALDFHLLCCKAEGRAPLTLENYNRKLMRFINFNNHTIIDIMSLRKFLSHLQDTGLDSVTINSYYRVIRTFLNRLYAEGMIDSNPIKSIKPPKMARKLPKAFSNEDISRLLIATSGNRMIDIRNRAIIFLLLDTGIRLAELAHIKISDCDDFKRESIRIMGKGSKERYVPVGARTQKAVMKYLIRRRDKFPNLWVTEENTPLSQRGCQIAIKRLCHIADIRDAKCGPHSFRHTAAITYLRNGGDVRTLQFMLGHSTLNMTMLYLSCLNNDDVQRVHKKASPVDNLKF